MISSLKTMLCIIILLFAVAIPAFSAEFYTDRPNPIELKMPSEQESFTFAIFGDRTTGLPSGLRILESAVEQTNVLSPDFVLTVGDMVQGYTGSELWLKEADEYKAIMNKLDMPWFPTPGNHDLYWRGENKPFHEHEANYEQNFGPLWYAFEHKNCWFIVLCADEGNPQTGEKAYNDQECQVMSPEQKSFLRTALGKAKDAYQVFIILHHPRWKYEKYGDDWKEIHKMLVDAGNVSACFSGQDHVMKYFGEVDGIKYYSLATTGGRIHGKVKSPLVGRFQHFDLVTVRGKKFSTAVIPVDTVIDPEAKNVNQVLLELEKWSIKNEDTRTISYDIVIPDILSRKAILKIGIEEGTDNVGDRGVEYELRSDDGEVILKGLADTGEDFKWVEYPVESGHKLQFLLYDNDTIFDGMYPGNSGYIVMELAVSTDE